MKETFDVVFHTDDGHVRCGPFPSYERAQEFTMGMDPSAFNYEAVEIVKHGEPVVALLAFRPAS